jgi:putative inorganic carbon (HCO3(-)) transporter
MGAERARSRLARGWIIDICLAIFLFRIPLPHTAALKAISFGLAALLLLLGLWHNPRAVVRRSGFERILLLWGLVVLASALFSVDVGYSLRQLQAEFLWNVALFYMLVWHVRRSRQLELFTWTMLAASFLVSAYGLYGYFSGTSVSFDRIVGVRATSLFGSHGLAAFFVAMITPLALSKLLAAQRTRELSAAAAIVAVNACFLVVTYARGSWVALAAAIAYLGIVRDRRPLVGLLLLGLLSPWLMPHQVTDRALSMIEIQGVRTPRVLGDRYWIWLSALEMIRDRPLLGWGYGSKVFQQVYPQYIHPAAVGEVFENAHSFYLQVAIEIGMIGLPVVLAFFGILIVRASRAARRRADQALAARIQGLIAGLVVFLVYGLTTYRFEQGIGVLTWFILGLLVVCLRATEDEEWKHS